MKCHTLSCIQCDTGEWTLSYHGPDISVAHQRHPEQTLRLDADGMELLPAPSAMAQLLGLELPANPVIKVQFEHLVLQPDPLSSSSSSATASSAPAKRAAGHGTGGSPTSSTNAAEALGGERELSLALGYRL
jgi:hypothetical protein